MIQKNFVENEQLRSRSLSEKKTHREHKYSITSVTKVGTKTLILFVNEY